MREKRSVGRPRKYPDNAARYRAYRQRRKRSVHFQSTTDLWTSPQALFEALDAEFHFTTDVCADASNAKCPHYFSEAQDGLRQRWEGTCWMNPPYGVDIHRWIQKAYDCSLYGVLTVGLILARTDTRWWHQYSRPLPAADVTFLPGRQRFNEKGNAPFPSVVVIFRPPL